MGGVGEAEKGRAAGDGIGEMAKKGYTPEQVTNKFWEAEILLSQGFSGKFWLHKL